MDMDVDVGVSKHQGPRHRPQTVGSRYKGTHEKDPQFQKHTYVYVYIHTCIHMPV